MSEKDIYIYSFKTDKEYDSDIIDVLESIPKGSKTAVIKQALDHYIEQVKLGVIKNRYIKKESIARVVNQHQEKQDKVGVTVEEVVEEIEEVEYEEYDEYEYSSIADEVSSDNFNIF